MAPVHGKKLFQRMRTANNNIDSEKSSELVQINI